MKIDTHEERRCRGTMTPKSTRCYFDALPGADVCKGHVTDRTRFDPEAYARRGKVRRRRRA